MRGRVLRSLRELRRAAERVEHLELGRGHRQLAVLVLPVEGDEPPAELAQVVDRGRPPVQEGARAARCRDAAPEHDLLAVHLERALDVRLLGARADDARPRLPAQQQVERVREHGLARAGLAGDDVQPGAEPELGALDQEEVLNPQLYQHRAGS